MAQKTPFYDIHIKHEAVMRERAGWLIPAYYCDPVAEYQHCSKHLTVFDTSDQYRFRISGSHADLLLNRLLTIDITRLAVNRQRYALIRDEAGAIIEELIVQHQDKGFLLIGNPERRRQIQDLLNEAALRQNGEVVVCDETYKTAMVTLIGPAAWKMLTEKLPFEVNDLQPGQLLAQTFLFIRFVISRLDRYPLPAVSIIMPAKTAPLAWDLLEKYGRQYQAHLAGTDTLARICREANMLQHGIDEE